MLRLTLVNATNTASDACRRHGVTAQGPATLLAKAISGAGLLSAGIKGEERCILQLMEQGQSSVSRRVYAEAMATGEVRGYISPVDEWPPTQATLSPAHSSLSVTNILYGRAHPVQSIVPAVAGDITSDLSEYFARSAQLPSAVHLEAELSACGTGSDLAYAGGLLAQRVARGGGTQVATHHVSLDDDEPDICPHTGQPWTTLDDIRAKLGSRTRPVLEVLLGDGPASEPTEQHEPLSLASLFRAGVSLQEIAKLLIPELATLPPQAGALGGASEPHAGSEQGMGMARVPLDFYCRCSKQKFLGKLGSSGPSLLRSLLEGTAPGEHTCTSLTCQFCNSSYDVTVEDVQALLRPEHASIAQDGEPGGESASPSLGRTVRSEVSPQLK